MFFFIFIYFKLPFWQADLPTVFGSGRLWSNPPACYLPPEQHQEGVQRVVKQPLFLLFKNLTFSFNLIIVEYHFPHILTLFSRISELRLRNSMVVDSRNDTIKIAHILHVDQGTVIMMFFQKMMKVHGYIGVKSYSKTLL